MARTAEHGTLATAGVTSLLTAAMTWPMLPLFLLGALGPYLITEFDIGTPMLGLLVSAGFAVAALLSLGTGQVVAAVGPRRGLLWLFGLAAVTLGFAAAPGYGLLVVAVAASGIPQALANPVTNQLIATHVPAGRRGGVTGWKQSGVQFGAFIAGLPLAALAGAVNWRAAVALGRGHRARGGRTGAAAAGR